MNYIDGIFFQFIDFKDKNFNKYKKVFLEKKFFFQFLLKQNNKLFFKKLGPFQ